MAVPDLADVYAAHRRFLWGLSYRLTGNAADADDVVQETFLRAVARPPARTVEPWRPWLVRVALNLGRDLLRRRRRRRYVGPWLPSPVESGEEPPSFEPAADGDEPHTRYHRLESVSIAFLLALEALTPAQRAVLLLRDAFDYSVREAADALGMSEANVKTTHLRARRALADYDRSRCPTTRALQERTREILERFLGCLASGDAAGMEALLARGVRALSDGGGEFIAALRPVTGPDRVVRFLLGIRRKVGVPSAVEPRQLNGLPAVVAEFRDGPAGWARRFVLQCALDQDGRIRDVYAVIASGKLTAVRASMPRA